MSEHVRIHGAAEIVSAVPALLGFQPGDCLVALFIDRDGGQVRCLVRQDLDTPPVQLSRTLIDLATRLPECQVVAVSYDTAPTDWSDMHEPAVMAGLHDLQQAGVTLIDSLLVTQGRWWSLMCTNPTCCPPEGQLVPAGTTAVEAARVTAGLPAVAASRDAVADRYTLRTPLAAQVMEAAQQAAGGSLQDRCDQATDLMTGAPLSPEKAAQLMVLLQDVHVRDWVLADLAAAEVINSHHVDALADLTLTAPDELRPRLAGTAAAVLAMSGDNPVALWAMVDHAGDDSLANLVAESVLACMPPEDVRGVFTQARDLLVSRMAAA